MLSSVVASFYGVIRVIFNITVNSEELAIAAFTDSVLSYGSHLKFRKFCMLFVDCNSFNTTINVGVLQMTNKIDNP